MQFQIVVCYSSHLWSRHNGCVQPLAGAKRRRVGCNAVLACPCFHAAQPLNAAQVRNGRIRCADGSGVPIPLTISSPDLNSETLLQGEHDRAPVLAQLHRQFPHSEWSEWQPGRAYLRHRVHDPHARGLYSCLGQ